ncbi:hypothetical protein H8959_003665 [Pygathrix nigripes]
MAVYTEPGFPCGRLSKRDNKGQSRSSPVRGPSRWNSHTRLAAEDSEFSVLFGDESCGGGKCARAGPADCWPRPELFR